MIYLDQIKGSEPAYICRKNVQQISEERDIFSKRGAERFGMNDADLDSFYRTMSAYRDFRSAAALNIGRVPEHELM
jgi:hypothetical protein